MEQTALWTSSLYAITARATTDGTENGFPGSAGGIVTEMAPTSYLKELQNIPTLGQSLTASQQLQPGLENVLNGECSQTTSANLCHTDGVPNCKLSVHNRQVPAEYVGAEPHAEL